MLNFNFRITLKALYKKILLYENNIHKISLNITRLYIELLIVDVHFNKVGFFLFERLNSSYSHIFTKHHESVHFSYAFLGPYTEIEDMRTNICTCTYSVRSQYLEPQIHIVYR